jgi:Mn2+/Fe2+ NRAMP family transporter
MQLFQQSSVVEKRVARRHYGPERIDAYAGAIFSNLIAAFIIIATTATLHVAGKTTIETAAAAAQALKPVAGDAAQSLFGIGLLGASLLAAGVLPLATAFSMSEALGMRRGVNLDFRRARFFLGSFTTLVALGAAIALIPNVPVIPLLVGVQVLNGVLLPITLVFLLLLINDTRLAGNLRNSRLMNVLGWGTFLLVTIAVVTLLGTVSSRALYLVAGGVAACVGAYEPIPGPPNFPLDGRPRVNRPQCPAHDGASPSQPPVRVYLRRACCRCSLHL